MLSPSSVSVSIHSASCSLTFAEPQPTLIRALLQQHPGATASPDTLQLWFPGTSLEPLSPERFFHQTARLLRLTRQLNSQLTAMQQDTEQPQAPVALGLQDVYVVWPQEQYFFLAIDQLCSVQTAPGRRSVLEIVYPDGVDSRFCAPVVRDLRALPAEVPLHCATAALAHLLAHLYDPQGSPPPSSKLAHMLQRSADEEEETPLFWF